MDKTNKSNSKGLQVMMSLLVSYIVTGIMLLLLSMLLYKFDLDDAKVAVGIIFIYILSCFLGGFIVGKKMGEKKFIWGAVLGGSYFILLIFLSLIVNRSINEDIMNMVTVLVLCVCGGMVGGMLS